MALNDTLGVKRAIKHFDFSEPYWEGTKQKKLLHSVLQGDRQVPALSAAGEHLHRPAARHRMARGVGQGRGRSYTITHRGTPAFRGSEPYAVVSVTLDVGVNFIANIINCSAEDLKVGMKVKPHWHPLEDGTNLLMFQPDP